MFSSGVFLACGSAEDSGGSGTTIFVDSTGQKKRLVLNPLTPQYLAYNRNLDNPMQLDRVYRILALNEFDVVVPPSFSSDGQAVKNVITGIGINAVDDLGGERAVKLGIVARKFDSKTGSFSAETRVFSPPRTTFEDSQREFVIMNDNNSNLLLTGLALRGSRVRLTALELQRKSLGRIYENGTELRTKNFVVLENGWAAIGFFIGFPSSDPTRQPYISDALIHTAELKAQ